MNRWRGNAVLLGVSVLMALYAGEALIHAWDRLFVEGLPAARVREACPGPASLDRRCLQALREGQPYDARSALQIFNERAAEGDTIWPAVPARTFGAEEGIPVQEGKGPTRILRPLSGISGVPTLLCNESGEWVTYEADEHGLNNEAGVHELDLIAIAVVGDSFAHGWCVPRAQTVAGLLALDRGPVVNLGLEAAGPLSELGILREYGADLRPRVVLWLLFGENDTEDLRKEGEMEALRRYLDPGYRQGLKAWQPALDQELRGRILELRRQDDERARARARRMARRRAGPDHPLVAWAKLQRLRGRIRALSEPQETRRPFPWDGPLLEAVLTRARDDVTGWGGQLILVYLPSWQRLMEPHLATPHKERILALVRGLGIL
ncbi:MAG: hypothetical protein OEO23_09720, partial [Gemmatimonadota bacterium]|nr:hypothetical protein [Gemmatimonadota bacterium]